MADFTVTQPDKLADFLGRAAQLQPWRIPFLIALDAITVMRGSSSLPSLQASTQLLTDDEVSLLSPLPALLPDPTDFRDYCFVPGTDPVSRALAALMRARPQSVLLSSMTDLKSFVDGLSGAEIKGPIRHIYVGSHANDAGDLFMALDPSSPQGSAIEFEDLEQAEKSGALKIDPKLLEPRPADVAPLGLATSSAGELVLQPGLSSLPENAQFRVRGCRIGKAKPFLFQLKKALGGSIAVNAPKHFDALADWSNPAGSFEYMEFDLQLRRTQQLKTSKEAVAAFVAAATNTAVLPSLIPVGVPANVLKQGEQTGGTMEVQLPFAKNANMKLPIGFRYHHEFFRTGMNGFPLPSDPKQLADRKKAMQHELVSNWPLFSGSHPFPEWMRLGYSNMAEFMDGYNWMFRYDSGKKQLQFNGDRHVYDLIIPITEKGGKRLICNFYPTSGGSVYESLDPADTNFYETV